MAQQLIDFLASDLREVLEELPPIRRKAVLFALAEGMTLDAVTDLRWKDVLDAEYCDLSYAILASLEKSDRLDYVFWEPLPQGPHAPLFGLNRSVYEAMSGRTFDVLRAQFSRMVLLDTRADALHFRELTGLTDIATRASHG